MSSVCSAEGRHVGLLSYTPTQEITHGGGGKEGEREGPRKGRRGGREGGKEGRKRQDKHVPADSKPIELHLPTSYLQKCWETRFLTIFVMW